MERLRLNARPDARERIPNMERNRTEVIRLQPIRVGAQGFALPRWTVLKNLSNTSDVVVII